MQKSFPLKENNRLYDSHYKNHIKSETQHKAIAHVCLFETPIYPNYVVVDGENEKKKAQTLPN